MLETWYLVLSPRAVYLENPVSIHMPSVMLMIANNDSRDDTAVGRRCVRPHIPARAVRHGRNSIGVEVEVGGQQRSPSSNSSALHSSVHAPPQRRGQPE